jgi:hypothetical protein
MARPSSLTPELRETIERQLEQGVPVTVTAQRVGVPKRTLHSWARGGEGRAP